MEDARKVGRAERKNGVGDTCRWTQRAMDRDGGWGRFKRERQGVKLFVPLWDHRASAIVGL